MAIAQTAGAVASHFEQVGDTREDKDGWAIDALRAIEPAMIACRAAGVAFFWKQHIEGGRKISLPELDGQTWTEFPQITA